MCGIIGYIGEKPAINILINGLKKLNYRGYDSSGVAIHHNNTIHQLKAAGKIDNLEKLSKLDINIQNGCLGIGHTRWATHGIPTDKNAHPHLSMSKKFSIVHNGIIENYKELKEFLISKGYQFSSDTDSEVIAHLLEFHYQNNPFKAIQKTTRQLKGSYAVALICSDFHEMILGFRKNNPLLIGLNDSCGILASDMSALRNFTENFIEPNEHEIAIVTKEASIIVDYSLNKIDKNIIKAKFDHRDISLKSYQHYMLKEIFDQPKAIQKTLHTLENTLNNMSILDNVKRINIIACGSSYNAGFAAKHYIEELTSIPVQVEMASEYRYSKTIRNTSKYKTLTIAISQSGETADTIGAITKAKKYDKILAIVNSENSTLARIADATLITQAGPEISVATTKGYSTQLTTLFMLAIELKKRNKKNTANHINVHNLTAKNANQTYDCIQFSDLKNTPHNINSLLKKTNYIQNIATEFSYVNHAFFIGRGTDFGIALEGALKLKEISYIHAQAHAAGELKHGTIALIEKGSLVVAISTNKQTRDKMLSSIKEVKARGAIVLSISPFDNILNESDHKIKIKEDTAAPLIAAIYCQLLSYYVALNKGCDIDMPRNLAKSVTVE
ncbi:MAG: glutamine--fructose-6-phosphate transaminase (isomerizing) [Firmicutes bacterium]|nr:glutamine--fructose-6-phosphate transaminase (isomerizing) [Bacillota bacterium]